MSKITVESCPSCRGSHSRVKLYLPKRAIISDGYFICPVSKEAVHHFDATEADNSRRQAYAKFADMIQRRRWLIITSISHVDDNVNVEHQVESFRMTHEFPKGDIEAVLDFIGSHIVPILPVVQVEELPEAKLSVHDPLAHLREGTDAENPAPAYTEDSPGLASGGPEEASVNGRRAARDDSCVPQNSEAIAIHDPAAD